MLPKVEIDFSLSQYNHILGSLQKHANILKIPMPPVGLPLQLKSLLIVGDLLKYAQYIHGYISESLHPLYQ